MIRRGSGSRSRAWLVAALAGVLLAGTLASGGSAGASVGRDASPRIVGGSPTTIGEWPWQAALAGNDAIYAGSGYQRQFCGASLVAPTIVITAAHCVFDFPVPAVGFNPASQFDVFTGRTVLSSSEGQVSNVAEVYHLASGPGGVPPPRRRAAPTSGPTSTTR